MNLDDRELFFKFFEVFAKVRRKNSILHIVPTPWRVREVESYALLKFQPPKTLDDRKSVFRHRWWISEELDNF